ncbi:AraC family transcriptional regulator [Neobacillus niacini]|uniref:AraC family transcriptional regulator n=1 Tax=Neobacillus niacini TaxID=86668 RepID=UPI00052F8264|nr:AraC family transcriptional regulator [Neobacillus niacini]KGM46262.1 AraC family transcriptional regulator [Neobacillus niacini]MEC1523741.1 AraC family transcriptional regulator [Neobacillus niacini]
MGWVESLQNAIDYMENHLLDDITIERIAKQANVSEFHFQRIFSVLTDITVGEYLRRRRLTLAAQELSSTESKIIDVALKYGYDTPESFSKAFRKQHGITPSQARNFTGKLKSYNRLTIQVNLKGAEPMNYKIVEKERFKVVGVKREFSCENGENLAGIPKMWDDVHVDGTNDLLFDLNNGQIEGVLGVCVDKRNSGSPLMDYWIGTDHTGETPEGLMELEIPASKWGVFEVHGPMPDAMQNTWKQIISEWFPSSHYQHAGTPDLEVYSNGNPSSPDYYSEIWIPLK